MIPSRIGWAVAAVAFLAAGVLDSAAALIHWSACLGVDYDSAGCIEAQRDYRYYQPSTDDGSGWQPINQAPAYAALGFLAAAVGWLAVVGGLRSRGAGNRVLLAVPAILPALSGIEILVGLAGGPPFWVLSLAVGVLSVWMAVVAIRERVLAPALVTVLGLAVVNASGFPAVVAAYSAWSSVYGSFDNPPFLGLERGVLGIGVGLVLGLVVALTSPPASPAPAAGAAVEGAAHR